MSIHKVCAEHIMLLHVMTKSLKFIIYMCNIAKRHNLTETLQHTFNLATSSPQLCHNLTTIYLQPPCNLIRTSLLPCSNLPATSSQPPCYFLRPPLHHCCNLALTPMQPLYHNLIATLLQCLPATSPYPQINLTTT